MLYRGRLDRRLKLKIEDRSDRNKCRKRKICIPFFPTGDKPLRHTEHRSKLFLTEIKFLPSHGNFGGDHCLKRRQCKRLIIKTVCKRRDESTHIIF